MKIIRTLIVFLILISGANAFGTTYTHTITASTYTASPQTKTLSSIDWTLTNNGGFYGYDATKGQQIGSAGSPATSMTFATSGIAGTITAVKVTTSGAASVVATVGVTLGGSAYGGSAQSISATSTQYTFSGSASGAISINWTQTSSKALYIKEVQVVYTSATDLYWGGTTGSYSGAWTTSTPWGTTTSSGATTAWPGSGSYNANFNAVTSGIVTIPSSISVAPNNTILNAATTFNTATATNGTLSSTINLNSYTLTAAPVTSTTLTLSGIVSGTGSITQNGAGATTLSSANTYSGGTTLTTGTLNINNATALGTGTLTINGGTIDNSSAGAITNSSNNVQTWGGDFTFTGTQNLNLGTGAVSLSANRTVTTNAAVLTIGGIVSGAYNLTKAGAGTLTLSGANTYSGGTSTINSGTLQLGANSTLPTTTAVSIANTSGAILDVNGKTQTIGSLAGGGGTGGNVTLGAGTLTVNGTSPTASTYSGVISGTGALVKSGTSTLTLAGTNTYTGTTTISAGTLFVNGSTASGSAVSVGASGTLAGSGTVNGTVALAASGGKIAPGASAGAVGTLTTGALTVNSASVISLDVSNVTGTPGTEWDKIAVSGNIIVPGAATINVDFGGSSGFSNATSYTWDFLVATGTGTYAPTYTINVTGISYTGTFSVTKSGNTLTLVYTAGCTAPSAQASFTSFANVGSGQMDVSFGAGTGGSGRLVVMKAGTSIAGNPTNGTSYSTWTSVFSTTPESIAANEKVVYKGTTSPVVVSGLSPETQYAVEVFEYNSTGDCYLTTGTGNTGTRYTLSTEPTAQPTSGFSSTTCTSTSVDVTVPAASAGADGYLLIYRAGGAPTGLPTDANSYSSGNTFGDATVAQYVNSASTVTVSGLSASTNYFFKIIPYNASSGAVAQTYNYLTTGSILQTNYSTLATSASSSSKVGTSITYGYTSNIAYASYQSTPVPASAGSSVGVYQITIKDGDGVTNDADALPTILSDISFTYTGTANTIKAAALFNSSNSKITNGDGTVTANGISFSSLGSDNSAPDNDSTKLILRVTFNTTVTDSQKLVFTVSSVIASGVCTSSQFAAANGGGASSENNTANNNNRIKVVATKLVFGTGPSNTANGASMSPAVTVIAQDANNNVDINFTSDVTLTCSTSGALSSGGGPVTPTTNTGTATFGSVVHGTDGTHTMTASASGVTTTPSSGNYTISTITNLNGDYRTKYTTGTYTWSGATTWQKYNISTDLWVDETTAPTTTRRVWIRCNITTVPSTTVKCLTIINGGTITSSNAMTVNDTLTVETGGRYVMNAYLTMDGNADGSLFKIDSSGTFEYANANTSPELFQGTERFHPNSNFIINNWDNATDFVHPTSSPSRDITLNTYYNPVCDCNYTAAFGNLYYRDLTGSDARLVTSTGSPSFNLTHRNLEIETTLADADEVRIIGGAQTIGIGGNVIVKDGNLVFSHASSSASKVVIEGDLIIQGSLAAKATIASVANSTASSVDLKGNLDVSGTTFLTSIDKTNNFLRFIGPSDSINPQTIDFDLTDPVNTAVDIEILSGAYTKIINQNFRLGTDSKVKVKAGGTFDFGFDGVNGAGTTPLNLTEIGTPTGTRFELLDQGTLKITNTAGVDKDIADMVGNVQISGSRSFSQIATFWYIGKNNQVTGDALEPGSSAKVVVCDLISDNTQLSFTNSTAMSSTTTVDPTFGGHLYVKKGQVIESTTAYITPSSGTLRMEPKTLYYVAKGNFTAAAAYANAELIPRLTGAINPTNGDYYLNGGTIELGATDSFQVLRGANRIYKNVKFSGANTNGINYKAISSNVIIDSSMEITSNSVVDMIDVSGNAVGLTTNSGANTSKGSLIMSGANSRLRIKLLSNTCPELLATATSPARSYSLTGGTVEFYGSSNPTGQVLRGTDGNGNTISYNKVEINAAAANYQSGSSFFNVSPSASFIAKDSVIVNSPAVFRLDETENVSGTGSFTVRDGATLLYGAPLGITTSNGANYSTVGNLGVTGTRNLATTASYGFVGNGDMVSGNALPTQMRTMYVDKATLQNFVSLTNSAEATDSIVFKTAGIVRTSANILYLSNAATANLKGFEAVNNTGSYSNDKYVFGNLRRAVNDIATYVFPIGDTVTTSTTVGERYNPLELIPTATPSSYVTAKFTAGDPGTITLAKTKFTCGSKTNFAEYNDMTGDGWWNITGTGQTFNYNVRLHPNAVNSNTNPNETVTVGNTKYANNYRALKIDAASGPTTNGSSADWSSVALSGDKCTAGTYYDIPGFGYNGFSDFAPGGGTGNTTSLPVELISLTATPVNNTFIRIDWSTALEINNAGFEVQRSLDGKNFSKIGWVDGNGNATQQIEYSLNDYDVQAGITYYYRLKQIDFDGQFEISKLVSAKLSSDNTVDVKVYPIPAKDKLNISINAADVTIAKVKLFNVIGAEVASLELNLAKGLNTHSLETSNLAAGNYVVSVVTANDVFSQKIVIEK